MSNDSEWQDGNDFDNTNEKIYCSDNLDAIFNARQTHIRYVVLFLVLVLVLVLVLFVTIVTMLKI